MKRCPMIGRSVFHQLRPAVIGLNKNEPFYAISKKNELFYEIPENE